MQSERGICSTVNLVRCTDQSEDRSIRRTPNLATSQRSAIGPISPTNYCPFRTAESQICWLTQGHNVSGIVVPRLVRIMDGLEPLRPGLPLTTTLTSKGTKIFEQKDSRAAKILVQRLRGRGLGIATVSLNQLHLWRLHTPQAKANRDQKRAPISKFNFFETFEAFCSIILRALLFSVTRNSGEPEFLTEPFLLGSRSAQNPRRLTGIFSDQCRASACNSRQNCVLLGLR
jgi:hypothetical protein